MSSELIETLPLAHRLALSYAPRGSRSATLALLALDARLAKVVREGGEAVIAQMKLAWWRERLAQAPADWPQGEPLLAMMRESGLRWSDVVPLVDGWEHLLDDQLDLGAITEFVVGRSLAWNALQPGEAVACAAREWAAFDLATNLNDPSERAVVLAFARNEPWARARLPRKARPLVVLHGLARRAMQRGGGDLLDGPGAMFTAMRLGILGR